MLYTAKNNGFRTVSPIYRCYSKVSKLMRSYSSKQKEEHPVYVFGEENRNNSAGDNGRISMNNSRMFPAKRKQDKQYAIKVKPFCKHPANDPCFAWSVQFRNRNQKDEKLVDVYGQEIISTQEKEAPLGGEITAKKPELNFEQQKELNIHQFSLKTRQQQSGISNKTFPRKQIQKQPADVSSQMLTEAQKHRKMQENTFFCATSLRRRHRNQMDEKPVDVYGQEIGSTQKKKRIVAEKSQMEPKFDFEQYKELSVHPFSQKSRQEYSSLSQKIFPRKQNEKQSADVYDQILTEDQKKNNCNFSNLSISEKLTKSQPSQEFREINKEQKPYAVNVRKCTQNPMVPLFALSSEKFTMEKENEEPVNVYGQAVIEKQKDDEQKEDLSELDNNKENSEEITQDSIMEVNHRNNKLDISSRNQMYENPKDLIQSEEHPENCDKPYERKPLVINENSDWMLNKSVDFRQNKEDSDGKTLL